MHSSHPTAWVLSNHGITIGLIVFDWHSPSLCEQYGGMAEDEEHSNDDHQQCIQDVDIDLLLDQRSVMTLRVFDHPKNRSYHDENAGDV